MTHPAARPSDLVVETSDGKTVYYVEKRNNRLVRVVDTLGADDYIVNDVFEVLYSEYDGWLLGRHIIHKNFEVGVHESQVEEVVIND